MAASFSGVNELTALHASGTAPVPTLLRAHGGGFFAGGPDHAFLNRPRLDAFTTAIDLMAWWSLTR